MGLVFNWLQSQGGAEAMATLNDQKAKTIYNLVDNSQDFYM
jgi:phosphoserine aminotransferase